MIIPLNSVASVLDTDTKIVYAKFQQGGFDITSGVHLDDLSEKFVSSISEDDIILINQFVGIIK
jgi:hypothetical protein